MTGHEKITCWSDLEQVVVSRVPLETLDKNLGSNSVGSLPKVVLYGNGRPPFLLDSEFEAALTANKCIPAFEITFFWVKSQVFDIP